MTKRIPQTKTFIDTFTVSQSTGDSEACSVIAATILTGLPLVQVQRTFSALGRQPRQPTRWSITEAAYPAMGFALRPLPQTEMRSRFLDPIPGRYRPHVTTRHPHRFASLWAKNAPSKLLAHTNSHALAIVGGVNHDWSVNRSLAIVWMWEVIPLSA